MHDIIIEDKIIEDINIDFIDSKTIFVILTAIINNKINLEELKDHLNNSNLSDKYILDDIINRKSGNETLNNMSKDFLIKSHNNNITQISDFNDEDLKLSIDSYNYVAFEHIFKTIKCDVEYLVSKILSDFNIKFYLGVIQLLNMFYLLNNIHYYNYDSLNIIPFYKPIIINRIESLPESINYLCDKLKIKNNYFKNINKHASKILSLYKYKINGEDPFWIINKKYVFFADSYDLLLDEEKNLYTGKPLTKSFENELKNKKRLIDALNIKPSFNYY